MYVWPIWFPLAGAGVVIPGGAVSDRRGCFYRMLLDVEDCLGWDAVSWCGRISRMGLLDGLESMAASALGQSGNPTAKIAGSLMQALEEHPGGLQGVMDGMKQNGIDPQAIAAGGSASATQIAQGLQGSPLVAMVAEKAGVSPEVAQELMSTVLPLVLSHFTQGGTAAPPDGGFAGLAGSLLSKFL